MDSQTRERVERAAREVLETAVGFAVLGLNRVQVERRRIEKECRTAMERQHRRESA